MVKNLSFFKKLLCVVVCFFSVSTAYAASDKGNSTYKYVVNLASSAKPIKSVSPLNKSLKKHYYYKFTLKPGSKYQYRLRLGFFKTRKETNEALRIVKNTYKDAWIDTIKKQEVYLIDKWKKKRIAKAPDNRRLTVLMEKARIAIVGKKYDKAIRLYTKVIQSNNKLYQQEAQEYLGVARERNGQLAHAKAEYQIYLKKYPDSENISRVKQRFDALLTAYGKPEKALPAFKKGKKQSEWQHFGIVLQFYDRDVIDTELLGEIVANSILSTNINYSSRLRNSKYKIRTNVAGTHIYDLQNSETDDSRLTSMYADIITPGQKAHGRVGRQKGRSGGVVGRFDGFDVDYRLASKYKLKFITGFPVELSKTVSHETDKYFYSLGMEVGPIKKYWDASVFMIQQQAGGIVDRNEVGAEVRYRSATTSMFSMLDYSVEFGTVNYFTTIYNRRFKDKSTLDVILDYRKSPFLTTTNALQGQVGVSSLDDLLVTLTEDEIAQLSIDRTSVYKSITVLRSQKLSGKVEFNADVSISNLSGTVSSGGVDAVAGTGNEYSASAGLIATNLMTSNDINIMNFRLSQLVTSDVMVLNVSSKFRLSREWRLNPRLRYELRDYDDGRDITKLKPSFRVNYRRSRNWQFEFQIDLEDKDTTTATSSESESSYFLHMGYIYIF